MKNSNIILALSISMLLVFAQASLANHDVIHGFHDSPQECLAFSHASSADDSLISEQTSYKPPIETVSFNTVSETAVYIQSKSSSEPRAPPTLL